MIVLLVIIGFLILADIASQASLLLFDNNIDKFDVELENNIPTWFSSAILLIAALLFALIAAVKWSGKDRFALYWTALAGLFFFMSGDETASVHEMFNMKALPMVNISPDAWIVVAAPLIIIAGVLFFRFFMHLPERIRNLMLLAMGLYIFGGLIIETIAINDVFMVPFRDYNLAYVVLTLIEEVLEMIGVAILIYTLLAYIGHEFETVRLRIDIGEPVAEAPADKLVSSPNITK